MRILSALLLSLILVPAAFAQTAADIGKALDLRSIGPALMGGRIADIAVHPDRPSTWYIGVGSGNVWKTTNGGVSFEPIFDDKPSYSIGDVAIDPNNPDVVWVGTGENVSGRHVAWGDGIYRSRNGGETWDHMGLEDSEHIGRILIDPRDSNHILVAAEGPLWSDGGDRGVYRSTDGGETWDNVLSVNNDTGVTDLEFHPTNPDVVYAATYQRRRKTWALLAGGPESGFYKSTDGGQSFRRITTGLPKGDVGKIGLAVTPADPDRVYATMESEASERGLYFSSDQGESFERRSSYTSGGTGPHYYQELEASHVDPDVIYQMDVWLHVSRDAGHSFSELETGWGKHSDNHAMWIDPEDPTHMLVGTDAGLYETFDEGKTFRHFPNLPISQFYKVAVNNRSPFYDVLGGAQDLGTLMGPSRTLNREGVRNRDWYVPLGSDGQGVAFDPEDDDIGYMATQQGNWYRHNKRTEEVIDIQPQPEPGDAPERWNWDAPILISPHRNRVYVASQRLWQSDDRGNSWTAISGDLTRDVNRYELEIMGRVWSVDALYHNGAMSKYSTITGMSESYVTEGVLYTASDDGLIQVSLDGGENWRQASPLPGVDSQAFINDVEASRHDEAGVFAIADVHKLGVYDPLVYYSRDNGTTWRSISGDLPDGVIAWMVQQDPVDEDLLFLAAENGLYFSSNFGENWQRLPGAPTIAFRDVKIQERDNDLVGATFGRGFYVLDDYTALRHAGTMPEGGIFPVRDAWWYVPNVPMQAPGKPTLGDDDFTTPNPDFGAAFTYYLPEAPTTMQEERRAEERAIREEAGDVPFPGWDRLTAEDREAGPRVLMAIMNAEGQTVRWLALPARAGVHRVTWDLRMPAPDPVNLVQPGFVSPWSGAPLGPLVAPGAYSAQLVVIDREGARPVGDETPFRVKALHPGDHSSTIAIHSKARELERQIGIANAELGEWGDRLRHMRAALLLAPGADAELFQLIDGLEAGLTNLRTELTGDRVRGGLNETTSPSIRSRVGRVTGSLRSTTQPPTQTQRRGLEIGAEAFDAFGPKMDVFRDRLEAAETALEAAGAPWTPGRSNR
ncbi:MAG: glycosyl hydrolase [Rhodothermales bacterium]|nr:glycosyl hydrolase [Rhodothermales bacterium]